MERSFLIDGGDDGGGGGSSCVEVIPVEAAASGGGGNCFSGSFESIAAVKVCFGLSILILCVVDVIRGL
jgi:hypothetical protein